MRSAPTERALFVHIDQVLAKPLENLTEDFDGAGHFCDPGLLGGPASMIDWYELPPEWLSTARDKLSREGVLYFMTRSASAARLRELQDAGMVPILWKEYDLVDAKPLIFRWFRLLQNLSGRAKNQKIFVYRIEGPAPAGKSPAASIAS